jgi:hypothetical protein
MATTSARRLTSLFSRSSDFVECSFVRCCAAAVDWRLAVPGLQAAGRLMSHEGCQVGDSY